MTVASSTDRATFPGNGTTTVFPLPFRFFANSEIQAWLVTNATGALSLLTLGTHYTLIGAGDPEVDGNPTSKLTMITAPTALQSLFVLRVIPVTQPTDIVNQGRFFPEIHENVFDRLTMLIQQANGESKGAIRVAVGDPEPARLPNAISRALLLMGFDSAGNPIAVAPVSGSSADLALSLASDTDPAKGAGQVGFDSALDYAANSVGEALKRAASHVESIADLLTKPQDTETAFFVRSYYAGGRTGGGDFYWDAVSVEAEDLGTIFQVPTVVTGRFKRIFTTVSPYDFGAVGDGVAVDTTPWNSWAAFVGGKEILPGSYLVSGLVKKYETPTFVNATLANTNHAAGFQALEKVQIATPEGDSNAAFGYRALANNTLGYRNVAFGREALFSQTGNLTTGNSNSAFGYQCMYNNTLGKDNVALGYLSMFFNTEGGGNVAVGYRALYNNTGVADTTGQFNVCVGYESLMTNSQGNSNTALGWRAMHLNNTGTRNTATGQEALRNNSIGTNNVATGYHALHNNTSASQGVAVGYESLIDNVGGASNTAVGYRALSRNTSGDSNTAIGLQALEFTIAGGSNLAGINCTGLGNGTRISANNQVQLGNSATTTYAYGAVQDRSDMRDKADIEDTELGIEFITGLRAVSGRWDMRDDYHVINEDGTVTSLDKDGSKKRTRRHQWFIAQEVEALCHKLGVDFGGLQHHAKSGGEDIYSIGYSEFIPPIVKAVQQCWARLDELEARISAIEAKQ